MQDWKHFRDMLVDLVFACNTRVVFSQLLWVCSLPRAPMSNLGIHGQNKDVYAMTVCN